MFSGNNDYSWANACVGENGLPGFWEYANGYSKAANFLLELVLFKEGNDFHYDEAVYPICFNMRHSIELRLKNLIEVLNEISEIKNIPLPDYKNILGKHDIGIIWQYLLENGDKIDRRYKNYFEKLNMFIVEIANVDPTAQTFRYPNDIEGKKHLKNISLINFINLKRSFNEIEVILNDLNNLSESMRHEYTQGSFTKHLSRKDLSDIAKKLPQIDEWRNDNFKVVKDKIKKDYQIGSKEFSEAIELIKKHHEFSYYIGKELLFPHLDKEELLFFLDKWINIFDIRYYQGIDNIKSHGLINANSIDAEAVKNDIINTNDAINQIISAINFSTYAYIISLYYFLPNSNYSEEFFVSYRKNLQKKDANNADKRIYFRSIRHLFIKRDLLPKVIVNLRFLNQKTLVDILVKKYNILESRLLK